MRFSFKIAFIALTILHFTKFINTIYACLYDTVIQSYLISNFVLKNKTFILQFFCCIKKKVIKK